MKKIEKINKDEFESLGTWVNALTDKVNELVDANNYKNINISTCIDGKQISTLVANVDSLNATVTTLTSNSLKSKQKLNIDKNLLKNAQVDITNINTYKGEI